MKKFFNYKYLSKQHLKGLDNYKCNRHQPIEQLCDASAVEHQCEAYCSPLLDVNISQTTPKSTISKEQKILPKWLAPNLITFAGFVLMAAIVVLLGVYDYGNHGPMGRDGVRVPDWVYTACAVFLFVAYNLDGLDGKQARRLGVSGPLGEMFDHGIDSYVVFFIPYGLTAVFGRDHEFTLPIFRGLLIVASVCLNFYVSHWEKYNTGILYLPWGYDISMWATSLLFLVPGLYGPNVYRTFILGQVTCAQALEVLVHTTGLLTTLPVAVYNVYLARKNRTTLHNSLVEILRPVWPMLFMNVAIIAWAFKSPSNILEYDPKAFMLLYGTHFSNISCRLIVAEMCKQRCELITWMSCPLLAGVAVPLYLPHLEVPMMYSLLLLTLVGHFHYGICVVRQLCAHYRISCFTVPKNKKNKLIS